MARTGQGASRVRISGKFQLAMDWTPAMPTPVSANEDRVASARASSTTRRRAGTALRRRQLQPHGATIPDFQRNHRSFGIRMSTVKAPDATRTSATIPACRVSSRSAKSGAQDIPGPWLGGLVSGRTVRQRRAAPPGEFREHHRMTWRVRAHPRVAIPAAITIKLPDEPAGHPGEKSRQIAAIGRVEDELAHADVPGEVACRRDLAQITE